MGEAKHNPSKTARSWIRPYTSVQWAWVRALRIEPSERWEDARPKARRRGPKKRHIKEAMRQRFGVRGL